MRRQILTAIAALVLPALALADITDKTLTIPIGSSVNLDNGTVVASGGDLKWDGLNLVPQGSAKLIGLGAGDQQYQSTTLAQLQQIQAFMQSAGYAIGVLTNQPLAAALSNGGHLAKIEVTSSTATNGQPLPIKFTTYGATASGGGGGGSSPPTITDVQNNSSLIPNGFPNSGVAPSTLIVIHGSNLADPTAQAVLWNVSAAPLPTTTNGASLTVSAGGKTYPIPLYYAIASQIAGVLPAAVPVGQATITATYNGQNSSPVSFTVVPTAFGISNYNGNTAVAQDSVSYALITPTNSAKPGGFVTLWGTGLGSDPADSDTVQSDTLNKINVQTDVYFGGVKSTNVSYVGSAFYPGVNIIVAQVPGGVSNGCFVSVAVVTAGQILSNTPTMALMDNGGVCSDPSTGLNGNQLGQLSGQTTVRTGFVSVGQVTAPGIGTSAVAFAGFTKYPGSGFVGGTVTVGACTVSQSLTGGSTGTTTALNAGTITLTGPGVSTTLQSPIAGTYVAQIASIPQNGGAFTFTGAGASGTDTVGPFTATVNFPNPLINWTNQSDSASVTRSAGQTYNWTGGAAGTYVTMQGSSSANGVSGSYVCIAPVEAKAFTVPPYILFALPAGSGTSTLENSTNFSQFSATGIDYGYAIGSVSVSVNSSFK